ncbi:hypothetical protein BCR36DRAFT_335770, partial [Piromyces finnis]
MKLFNFKIIVFFVFILIKRIVVCEDITLVPGPVTCDYSSKDSNENYDINTDTNINCEGSSCTVNGNGATISNEQVTITTAGTFIIKGLLEGQIRIEAAKEDFIHLILENATIKSNNGPAIYGVSADKVTLTLVGENTLSDSSNYTVVDEEPDACLFIDSDLTINGSGSLNVTGNYSDAIRCKSDLKIVNGNISVPSAVQRGIKAKNSICIKDGSLLDITSNNSALKVTRMDNPEKGFIVIDGGNIVISTTNDAIHAESHLTIRGGYIDIKSCKEGLEAQMIDILGGEIHIVSSDDGINATKIAKKEDTNGNNMFGSMPATGTDGSIYINIVGGKTYVTMTGMDVDGIDSNGVLYIGSEAQVYISIEGDIYGNMAALDAEGSNAITSGSTIVIAASGMGGMGGMRGDFMDGGNGNRPSQPPNDSGNGNRPNQLSNDSGNGNQQNYPSPPNNDGFMNEGNRNPPNGSNMNMTPQFGESGKVYQPYIKTSINTQSAGTEITVKDTSGNVIVSYTPDVSYSNLLITSPSMKAGEAYIINSGSESITINASEESGTVNSPSVSSP